MTFTTNSLSYTQEMAEKLMANFIPTSSGQLKYESTYGCGEFQGVFSTNIINWESLKEELFREYDDLWRELANS
jgi:hypothetical protein